MIAAISSPNGRLSQPCSLQLRARVRRRQPRGRRSPPPRSRAEAPLPDPGPDPARFQSPQGGDIHHAARHRVPAPYANQDEAS